MAEAERASFVRYSTTRAPGKRQIKPTAAMADLVLPADDEEDDADWGASQNIGSGSDDDGSSSSSGSGEESSSDDESENSEGNEDVDNLRDDADLGLNMVNGTAVSSLETLVCSLCLNLNSSTKTEEVMQCDKCGVCVHDTCYVTDIPDDASSTGSESTTEPWFCEPCLFGLSEPPHCELCPNRFGAFKRTDIGGHWVHVLCAYYTSGVTFGDIDRLSAISYQELDFSKMFGKRTCSGCPSKVDARVGIAVECDVALCKNFYHPTCAQRLGLLIDHSSTEETTEIVETKYIHCKKHSQEEIVRQKRMAYASFLRHEEKRMKTMKRKILSEREERFRVRNYHRLLNTHKLLEGHTISWPATDLKLDAKQRRIRPLHTSHKILEAFMEKAEEEDGTTRDEFEKAFFRVRGETLPFLSPGFSTEFVAYFLNREKNVFEEERIRLETIQKQNQDLKRTLRQLEHNVHSLSEEHSRIGLDDSLSRLHNFHCALVKLGVKKIHNPFVESGHEKRKPSFSSPSRKRISSTNHPLVSPSSSKEKIKKTMLHTCRECSKSHDQHMLIECDMCKHYYHLSCLDPPLDKMPKKTNFDWHCSNCIESDEDDDSDEEEKNKIDEDAPRRLRQRCDMTKAKKVQEAEAERRAFASVMRTARQPKTTNKRKTIDGIPSGKNKKKASSSPRRSLPSISSPVRSPSRKSSRFASPAASPEPKKLKRNGSRQSVSSPSPVVYFSPRNNGLESEASSDSEEFVLITR